MGRVYQSWVNITGPWLKETRCFALVTILNNHRLLPASSAHPYTLAKRLGAEELEEWHRDGRRQRQVGPSAKWLRVKTGYPKFNLGKWKYELKTAVPWWFSFDPQPNVSG